MNPSTIEAARPQAATPESHESPDIIATFQDEAGNRTPVTKECVQLVLVEDRPYLDHCLVTIDCTETFLKPPEDTVKHLLESGVVPKSKADIKVETLSMYANYMSRRHGTETLPELIPIEG